MFFIAIKSLIKLKKHTLIQLLIFISIPLILISILNFQLFIENEIRADAIDKTNPFDFQFQTDNKDYRYNKLLSTIFRYSNIVENHGKNSLVSSLIYSSEIPPSNFMTMCLAKNCRSIQVLIISKNQFKSNDNIFLYSVDEITDLNFYNIFFKQIRSNDSEEIDQPLSLSSSMLKLVVKENYSSFITHELPNNDISLILSYSIAKQIFSSAIVQTIPRPIYLQTIIETEIKAYVNYSRSILFKEDGMEEVLRKLIAFQRGVIDDEIPQISSIQTTTIYTDYIEINVNRVNKFNQYYFLLSLPIWLPSIFLVFVLQNQSNQTIMDFLTKVKSIGIRKQDIIGIISFRFILINIVAVIITYISLIMIMLFSNLQYPSSDLLVISAQTFFINIAIQFVTNFFQYLELVKKLFSFVPEEAAVPSYKFNFTKYTYIFITLSSISVLIGLLIVIIYSNIILKILFNEVIKFLLPKIINFGIFILLIILLRKILFRISSKNYVFTSMNKEFSKFNASILVINNLKKVILVLLLIFLFSSIVVNMYHFDKQDQEILGLGNGFSDHNFDNETKAELNMFDNRYLFIDTFNLDYQINIIDQPLNITYFILDPTYFKLFGDIVQNDFGHNLFDDSFTQLSNGKAFISKSLKDQLNLGNEDTVQFNHVIGNDKVLLENKISGVFEYFDLFSKINKNWVLSSGFLSKETIDIEFIISIVVIHDFNKDEILLFEEISKINIKTEEDVVTNIDLLFFDYTLFEVYLRTILFFLLVNYFFLFYVILIKYNEYFLQFRKILHLRGAKEKDNQQIYKTFILWFNTIDTKYILFLAGFIGIVSNRIFQIPIEHFLNRQSWIHSAITISAIATFLFANTFFIFKVRKRTLWMK